MKFCSECGTKFADDAKFCAECGATRTPSTLAADQGAKGSMDWAKFVKTYRPKANQFADKNEALDGYFFPSSGSVGDWITFEDHTDVWSVWANDDPFLSLECKSGRWTGPNIIGYLFCAVSVPEGEDLSFQLPEKYTGFQGFILKVDEETAKWRPCEYRLKGDTSGEIDTGKLASNFPADELHRDVAEESTFARVSSRVMARITLEDSGERDTYAEKLDPRYFMLASAPAWGWVDDYVDEYEPLDSYSHIGEPIDDYEYLMMFNSPHAGSYFERVSRCPICDAESEDDELDELSDHTCMNGDIGDAAFASFDQHSKLQYVRANIPLPDAQIDERSFRENVLPFLLREFRADNISGFDYFERRENEMADSAFQLAFKRDLFAWDKLTKACSRCYKYNPESAQVCYNCCNQFSPRVNGQLIASIIRDVDTGQIDEMEPEEFAAWVNVFYYVAESKSAIMPVVPTPVHYQELAAKLSREVNQLIGSDGFFNYEVSVRGTHWIFSGSVTGEYIQLSLSGKHFAERVVDQLAEQGWEQSENGDIQMFDLFHSFVDEEDCLDSVTYGLSWLQELSGVSPENWVSEFELHLGE